MSRVPVQTVVVPSVLDRLMGRGLENADPYTPGRLRQDLLRDLEHLFNTRAPNVTWPDDDQILSESLLAFGRPELGTISLERHMEDFRRQMEDLIRKFEPRFDHLKVEIIELPTTTNRVVKLRIDGTLRAVPTERMIFGSQIDLATGVASVKNQAER